MANYIIINGSPREGNSKEISEFIDENINDDVEIFNIKDKNIEFCHADNACKASGECGIHDDAYDLINKLEECDGAFLVTPIYFARLPGPVYTLIDRFFSKFNPAKGMKEPDENKKLGYVFTYGNTEEELKEAYGSMAEQNAVPLDF
ncbi:hypothetical protein BGI41_08030 [Methanobrevibacter sp. 87.7]|uniref:flavodoxin family protein n=1 Tax=Methanobrevibacter sp. 87.7 TaxID=387957 RepID=UPI000B50DE21|nr:flavodoxin family protein [Methanobrevibacter sp. 87.7]OWT32366.1 hypothetical protein BGI41_08030 [Methanobrevibacter sp. 87.7]